MSDMTCRCGHSENDHHGWYLSGVKGRISDECEAYGFNELGGKMPIHLDGKVCRHAGIRYKRDSDGIYRAPDGSSGEDHECHEEHTWVDHCYGFLRRLRTV